MTTRLPNHSDDPQAENIARALGKAKRSGDGWVCICPAHADRTPSLSITQKNGKLLWHCHAKCSQEAVRSALAAAGVLPASEWGELSFEERITRTYDYRNYQVARFHSPKDFRHFHLDEAGRRVWKMTRADGTKIELRLYRQDELAADMTTRRRKDKPKKCLILEGEKDVDAAREIGLPATTNSAGAKKWRHRHSALLQEAGVEEIVIIPDNDETGRTHADQVARESMALGIGVRVCPLPVEEKGDLSDYLAAPDHDLQALVLLLKEAPEWEPPLIPGFRRSHENFGLGSTACRLNPCPSLNRGPKSGNRSRSLPLPFVTSQKSSRISYLRLQSVTHAHGGMNLSVRSLPVLKLGLTKGIA